MPLGQAVASQEAAKIERIKNGTMITPSVLFLRNARQKLPFKNCSVPAVAVLRALSRVCPDPFRASHTISYPTLANYVKEEKKRDAWSKKRDEAR